jgi:hypothetical protein
MCWLRAEQARGKHGFAPQGDMCSHDVLPAVAGTSYKKTPLIERLFFWT